MTESKKTVLVIGGTGAQGVPVVKALTSDGAFRVRVVTQNANSSIAKDLASIPGVTIFEGDSNHEPTLRRAFKDITHVFANTNGFAIGEKAEIYWGIRLYELSREYNIEHFVWAGLFYATKLGNFDPKYRTGHLDGKAKVSEFLMAQPTSPMKWSILTSCLYAEGLFEVLAPQADPENPSGKIFQLPLGEGRLPLVYLEDYGAYARWMFSNPDRSNGLNLPVATEDISWSNLASVFTKVTGIPARYIDCTIDEYFKLGIFPDPEARVGYAAPIDDDTIQTVRQNFSGFWNTWKDELTHRDYSLLDDILPGRVKSLEEWMRKVGYTGEKKAILKDYADGKGLIGKHAGKTGGS